VLNTKLFQALAPTLKCNAARLQTLCLSVRAIIRHRTSNLVALATTADGKTCSNKSRYRRFQDFFLRFSLCMPSVARIILTRIPTQKDGYLPASEIKALTMDRECIAKKWLQWLESQNIGSVVRIKKNGWVGDKTTAQRARSRGDRPKGLTSIFGCDLSFGCQRIQRGGRESHFIVISTRLGGKEALAIDRKRWGIERLFGHLKKNGFDLEATHITQGVKLEKFFALVAPWTGSNPAHPNLLDFDEWLNSKQLTSISLVECAPHLKLRSLSMQSEKFLVIHRNRTTING
jgi:hypothetical protein